MRSSVQPPPLTLMVEDEWRSLLDGGEKARMLEKGPVSHSQRLDVYAPKQPSIGPSTTPSQILGVASERHGVPALSILVEQ